MGRKKIFTDDEIKKRKNMYMMKKEWYCEICANRINYSLAGKTNHIRTKRHAVYAKLREAEKKSD